MKKIFIHGLGQGPSSWEETISHMDGKDKVLCPDLSQLLEDKEVTYENLYEGFSKYCDSIEGTIDLCGLSLGGVIALNYAIDNPEKVNSLVLIAAQYHMPKTLLKVQNIIFRFMPNKAFASMGMKKKDFITLTKSMMDLNFTESLKNISCSTLVICGEKDSANKKASKEISEAITKSEIKHVKNAKHEVNVDEPKVLAEILNDFYGR